MEPETNENKAFNPNARKELSGLAYGLLFLLGLLVSVAGFGLIFVNIILGNLVWLIGTALLVVLIRWNFKNKQGSGFRTGNIIIKIVVICCSVVLLILMNLTMIAMIRDGV